MLDIAICSSFVNRPAFGIKHWNGDGEDAVQVRICFNTAMWQFELGSVICRMAPLARNSFAIDKNDCMKKSPNESHWPQTVRTQTNGTLQCFLSEHAVAIEINVYMSNVRLKKKGEAEMSNGHNTMREKSWIE